MPSCTCQDWTNWHIPCKHFFTIFKHRSAWQWSNLPPSYLHSPYLSTDVGALEKHFDESPVLNLNDDNDVHDAELIQQSTQNLQVKYNIHIHHYDFVYVKIGMAGDSNLCGQTVQTFNCWYHRSCSAGQWYVLRLSFVLLHVSVKINDSAMFMT